jgi:uncharacterized protein YcbK (DUF882 family)
MNERRTTVMILVPGRNAVSVGLPRSPRRALSLALLLPLFTGGLAQRYVSSSGANGHVAMASLMRVPGPMARVSDRVLHSLSASIRRPELPPRRPEQPQPPMAAPAAAAAAPAVMDETSTRAASAAPVLDVKAMLRGMRKGTASTEDIEKIPCTGTLRLEALHLNETISVTPFDAALSPDVSALAQINHVMRCRITGTEVPIDTRLVQVLVKLHTLYGRAIQLVSGHRQPLTIGTKKTSQHTLGRAADIRIPGVGIDELKRVAMKLGARGIGLYPEKGFVHVDVREKSRYFWVYTGAGGEQSDMSTPRPVRAKTEPSGGDPESELDTDEHGEPAQAAAPVTAAAAATATAVTHEEPKLEAPRPAAARKPRTPAARGPEETPQPSAAVAENPYDVAPQAAPEPAVTGAQ